MRTRLSTTREAARWRSVLIAAQVSMSLVLLVGAGIFLRSWQEALAVDPGFGRAPTSIVSVLVPASPSAPGGATDRTQRLLEHLRTLPGATAVGLIWPLPLDVSSSTTDFVLDGRVPPAGREAFRADRAFVDGGFFEAAGITIVEGRAFAESDRRDSLPVAVISRAMARRYWPAGDALGRVLRRPDPAQADLTIVGVASDINVRSLGEAPRDVVYEAYTQGGGLPGFSVLVRTGTDPAVMSRALVAAGQKLDPDLRVTQATTLAQHLAMSRLPSQMGTFLLSAFATLAMALAAIGIYGMVRHVVATRTREVGIRMALGADAASVARLLASRGLRPVLIGGALGLAASLLAARALSALLFGVGTFEPAVLVGAPLALGLTAWLAAWLPARRASRVDPLAALRAE
jgi:predicted permease